MKILIITLLIVFPIVISTSLFIDTIANVIIRIFKKKLKDYQLAYFKLKFSIENIITYVYTVLLILIYFSA